MIVVDMTAAQAIKRGARTALIRRSLVPYKQLRQPIIVLREARPEDPPIEREQQLKTPEPVVRDKHAVIDIVDQEKVKLRDITADQAAAAGFPNLREFRRAHTPQGEHTMPNHSVLVVSFELQRSEVAPLRLLGRDGQYTQSPALAIHEAGEAVDESTQQRYTDEAKGHDTLRHEQRRERWDLAARLERAEARAAAQGINVSNHRRAIAERIARMERAVDEKAA
jgi:hypothetical protein